MIERVYRALLCAYPVGFRDRFEDELCDVFLEGFRCARRQGSWTAAVFLCTRFADAIHSGLAERWSRLPTFRKGWQMMMSRLAFDLRSAFRLVRRQPGFTTVVVLTLALGIGANSAVFSLVDGMILRPLPYRDPSRLAFLWTKLEWIGVPRAWISGGHVAALQRETTLVESFVVIRPGETQLTDAGDPEQVRIARTTVNLFEVLGVAPLIGRGFRPGEDREGTASVAVLDYALWQQRFGGDASVLGRRISLGGRPYEVVGVMPAGFSFMVPSSLGGPVAPDVWVPGTWNFQTMPTSPFSFALMVRLKPGVTIAQARAELDSIGGRVDRQMYGGRGFGWQIVGVVDDLTAQVRPTLWILMAAAGLVLLIACANVASLFLVRAVGREREIAVRTAIGASRWRLATQLFIEAVAVTTLGMIVALGFATMAIDALKRTIPTTIPRLDQVSVDWRVLAATSVATLVIAALFALLPILHLRKPALAGVLKEGARSLGGVRTQRLRSLFVVGEVAMALMLLVGAVLLIRTFAAIRNADPGFDPGGVITARLSLPGLKYPDGRGAPEFVAQVIARVKGLPTVREAGAANAPPLSQGASQYNARPIGLPDSARLLVDGIVATPGYLRAAGLTLVSGRDFTIDDREGSRTVAIVDDVFARAVWPNADPIGKTIALDVVEAPLTIVGVVRQAHLYQMHRHDRAQVYLPHAQTGVLGMTLVVRGDGDPASLGPAIRRVVTELDPGQPVADLKTLRRVVDDRLSDRKLSTLLLGIFASVALLLAAVGIYGLMAYAVSQRTAEIGIRMALGAQLPDIRRLVLARTAWLTMCGLAIGTLGAYAASGWLSAQLYGVAAGDLWTFALVTATLLCVALAASYVPARRAARIDPASALRSE